MELLDTVCSGDSQLICLVLFLFELTICCNKLGHVKLPCKTYQFDFKTMFEWCAVYWLSRIYPISIYWWSVVEMSNWLCGYDRGMLIWFTGKQVAGKQDSLTVGLAIYPGKLDSVTVGLAIYPGYLTRVTTGLGITNYRSTCWMGSLE